MWDERHPIERDVPGRPPDWDKAPQITGLKEKDTALPLLRGVSLEQLLLMPQPSSSKIYGASVILIPPRLEGILAQPCQAAVPFL